MFKMLGVVSLKLMNIKPGLIIIMFSFFSSPLLALCDCDSRIVGAKYNVKTTDKNMKVYSQEIIFWRMNNQVAYQYINQQVTEVWQLASNGMIRPVRYYDLYQRGIEYQASEINYGKGERNWS